MRMSSRWILSISENQNVMFERSITMVEVTVTINFQGKNYQTNVIVNKGASSEQIYQLAQKQVRKQWAD